MNTTQNYESHDPLLERQGARVSYTRIGPMDKCDYRAGLPSENLFVDEVGSKSSEPRPALEKCLNSLQSDDILFVKSMDRLGRNIRELVDLVKRIASKGTAIVFMDEDLRIDPRAQDFEANFRWLKSIYDFEQTLLNERRNEGVLKAKNKGIRLGRPAKISEEQRKEIRERLDKGDKVASLAKEYNISGSLVYAIGREG
ncbi:recombinase family protein [Desulfovibrio sp. Huiquan2017]|uniref:recombinase family protein n=1 Tax=Desulfovibrio sp. Huiquan2017 TaxID=2816861 RepID=UPI001A9366B9|nr:recombinase family protein [Desulfovibrio sp. Huiquan2017]